MLFNKDYELYKENLNNIINEYDLCEEFDGIKKNLEKKYKDFKEVLIEGSEEYAEICVKNLSNVKMSIFKCSFYAIAIFNNKEQVSKAKQFDSYDILIIEIDSFIKSCLKFNNIKSILNEEKFLKLI